MGKENYIVSQMGEEEGDISNKLSNQFQQLKAVVAFRRYLLICGLNTTIAQLQSFFPLWLLWQQARSQVFVLAGNRSRSLHSNREQLPAAPLNFKVLCTSLEQVLQPVTNIVRHRAAGESYFISGLYDPTTVSTGS